MTDDDPDTSFTNTLRHLAQVLDAREVHAPHIGLRIRMRQQMTDGLHFRVALRIGSEVAR